MTTTNLSLNVTIDAGDPTTLAGVFADLTELATGYTGTYAGVSVSAYTATEPVSDPTPEDLGRIARDAFISTLLAAEVTDPESVEDFDDLHPDYRHAWIQTALAARNA